MYRGRVGVSADDLDSRLHAGEVRDCARIDYRLRVDSPESASNVEIVELGVMCRMNFSLQRVLPAFLGIIHMLYRREMPAKLGRVSTKAGINVICGLCRMTNSCIGGE